MWKHLKVGDQVEIERLRDGGWSTVVSGEVVKVGRRWVSVQLSPRYEERFDRETGLEDCGEHTARSRLSSPEMREQKTRKAEASKTIRTHLWRHGWWTGDGLPLDVLEKIAALLKGG